MAHTIIDPEAFARHIERVVARTGVSYMDALVAFCEKRQLDPETIAPFVSAKIRKALQTEAVKMHLLPKLTHTAELPLD